MATPPKLDPARCAMIAESCTFFNVRKAARAVGEVFDDALEASGLRATQFNLLIGIGAVRSATVSRLASSLSLDRTTLTRNLAPLERDGLVESVPGKDGRERHVRLTERGSRKVAEAMALWERGQRKVISSLGETHWRDLMAALKLTASLPGLAKDEP